MEPSQNLLGECHATFDVLTYYRRHPSTKDTYRLPCEQAKIFLESVPQDKICCSRRIKNLKLTEKERSYLYHSEDTADMSIRRIKFFEHKLLPDG